MRELATALLLLVSGWMNTEAQASGAFSPGRAMQPDWSSSIGDVAVFEAPIGHRQPTVFDLPEWLRKLEESGFKRSVPAQDASPITDVQPGRRKPKGRNREDPGRRQGIDPFTGAPQICRGC